MTASIKQLREDLANSCARYHGFDPYSGSAIEESQRMYRAAVTLLGALEQQSSRQGKPWRLTFQHTQGPLAGKVIKSAHRDIYGAVAEARIVMTAGGRIEISKREEDGSYTPLTTTHLADWGYPEFGDYELYGDAHYSRQES